MIDKFIGNILVTTRVGNGARAGRVGGPCPHPRWGNFSSLPTDAARLSLFPFLLRLRSRLAPRPPPLIVAIVVESVVICTPCTSPTFAQPHRRCSRRHHRVQQPSFGFTRSSGLSTLDFPATPPVISPIYLGFYSS